MHSYLMDSPNIKLNNINQVDCLIYTSEGSYLTGIAAIQFVWLLKE
jgi:basic membrane lipoprotein Med (substrate-binding protein (PBP1-ABC) superfamily)